VFNLRPKHTVYIEREREKDRPVDLSSVAFRQMQREEVFVAL